MKAESHAVLSIAVCCWRGSFGADSSDYSKDITGFGGNSNFASEFQAVDRKAEEEGVSYDGSAVVL